MNRAEHLAWAKARAQEYVEQGDNSQALASLASDLGKSPETEGHAAIMLGAMLMIGGVLSTKAEMREFIDGCN